MHLVEKNLPISKNRFVLTTESTKTSIQDGESKKQKLGKEIYPGLISGTRDKNSGKSRNQEGK